MCLGLVGDGGTGYVTEKIVNAFLAGCIPIYWGSRRESLLEKKGGTSVDFLVLGLYWISSTRTLSSLPTRFRLCLWQMVEVDQQTF